MYEFSIRKVKPLIRITGILTKFYKLTSDETLIFKWDLY